MIEENESDIDLEEAVGSYLNCLSTSCAAGSKLYTSVGKVIDEKFHEIFPDHELNNQLVKTCFQWLQVQNAFEGYQKALLECKEKLLEILIDNHTKKYQPSKDGKYKKEISPEEQYAAVAFIVAKELYCYHQTVAEVLKPLLFSDFQEDFENATLTSVDGKDDIVTAWCTISEANKVLRHGYGLTNLEIGQILSWQHGADLSESCRKKLNQKINQLIQQYVDKFYNSAACEEIDIPLAFSRYPDDIQKLLQNCCSPSEALAASAQGIPVVKEEIEVMLHRELPRISLCLNGRYYDKASPGKAFENTTLKMRAIREIISNLVELKKIDVSKEQIDLFCLRVLATSSITISYASSRTAVMLAFGKCNLVQVKAPLLNGDGEKVVYFNIHQDIIEIDIQSKWCITEDSTLFASLCRDNTLRPIATVDVSYHVIINVEEYLVNRIEPTPVAHITQCVLRQSPTGQQKKEPGRERSKSIKIRLTRATTKLFHRKPVTKTECEADIITNEYANENEEGKDRDRNENVGNSSCDSENEVHPIPPPRHKRKAKKSRKTKCEFQLNEEEKDRKEKEEKKEDLGWYSSSPKFGIPPVATISGSKDFSPSVASFEELQGVIDFLSGSSSSSLAVNEKGEKIRPPCQTHKRNNSTTSLQSESKVNVITPEGKLKLCHKKSASFSGETTDMNTKEGTDEPVEDAAATDIDKLSSNVIDDSSDNSEEQTTEVSSESTDVLVNKSVDSSESVLLNVERTPGDGMDNRIDDKNAFNSTVNIVNLAGKPTKDDKDLVKVDDAVPCSTNTLTLCDTDTADDDVTSLSTSLGEVTLATSDNKNKNKGSIQKTIVEKVEKSKKIETASSDNKVNKNDRVGRNVFSPIQTSLMDISEGLSSAPLTKHLNSDIVKSEPNYLNTMSSDHSFYGNQQKINTDLEIAMINNKRIPADTERNLQNKNPTDSGKKIPNRIPSEQDRNSQTRISTIEPERSLQNRISMDSERNLKTKHPSEPERNTPSRISIDSERSDSMVTSPLNEFEIPGEERSQQILYEPFNSKWSVALGSKPVSWSDATFDTECPTPKNEKLRLCRPNESEFTWDKQLDFNKLLEGSKFFAGQTTLNENWKDRSYLPGGQPSFDSHHDVFPVPHQQPVHADPWPLHSNTHNKSYSPFPPISTHQSLKRNIESLQLPPNPVGPYMRQNREQLLAKQQILEQYARHQKQIQLQQKQQHQQQHQQQQQQQQQQASNISSKQLPNSPMTLQPTSSVSNFRLPHTHAHSAIDRSMSLPPGFSANDRISNPPSQRYDMLPERPVFRPLNQQRSGPGGGGGGGGQYLYGNQFSSLQSRSVNDIRMENASLLSERSSFSQMSEQNIYLDQCNQLPDAFSSRF